MSAAEILERIATRIDQHKCSDCAAQNEHDACEHPDLAAILREVIREITNE